MKRTEAEDVPIHSQVVWSESQKDPKPVGWKDGVTQKSEESERVPVNQGPVRVTCSRLQ